METIFCIDCGEKLDSTLKVCPNCGCPVEHKNNKIVVENNEDIEDNNEDKNKDVLASLNEENLNNKSSILSRIRIRTILQKINFITLIMGIAIVMIGVNVKDHKVDVEVFSATPYDVDSAKFGADFYTEIYDASDTIVDELSDINSGLDVVSNSQETMIEAIYYAAGMIIIVIGLYTIAKSFDLKKEVSFEEDNDDLENCID